MALNMDAGTRADAGGATVFVDLLFFAAMAAFAGAIGTAALAHFSASLTIAAGLGAGAFVVSILMHIVLRRWHARQQRHGARFARAVRPQTASARSVKRAKKPQGASEPVAQRPPKPAVAPVAKPVTQAADGNGAPAPDTPAAAQVLKAARSSHGHATDADGRATPRVGTPHDAAAGPGPAVRLTGVDGPSGGLPTDAAEGATQSGTSDVSSFWSLRPGDVSAGVQSGSGGGPALAMPGVRAQDMRTATAQADASYGAAVADVALVNSILKRMARDIQKGRAQVRQAQLGTAQPGPAVAHAVTGEEAEAARKLSEAFGSAHEALAARKAATPTAREASADPIPVARPAQPQAGANPVVAIASALAAERVSVFLEPIKALDSGIDQHYELSLRLKVENGAALDREAYTDAASGTAVLPLIDTVALMHARRLVWRKIGAQSDGRMFTAVAGETLISDQFAEDVERMVAKDDAFPRRIVLSIDQADARLFTPAHLDALAGLAQQGIVFALQSVVDLDMDFGALAKAGFRFVKLDADIFLDGLPVGTSRVPSADICRHLRALGLLAIVGHIRDDEQANALKLLGVTLGQGPMFGPRELITADVKPE